MVGYKSSKHCLMVDLLLQKFNFNFMTKTSAFLFVTESVTCGKKFCGSRLVREETVKRSTTVIKLKKACTV